MAHLRNNTHYYEETIEGHVRMVAARLKFQVDLLAPEAANELMGGPGLEANAIGEPFDHDELVGTARPAGRWARSWSL